MLLAAGCAAPSDVRHELRVTVSGEHWDVSLPLPVSDALTAADWSGGLRAPFGNGTATIEDGRLRLIGNAQVSVESFVLSDARPAAPQWPGLAVHGKASLVSVQYDAVAPDGCWREASLGATDGSLSGPDQSGCP